jgi:hypothetical protein
MPRQRRPQRNALVLAIIVVLGIISFTIGRHLRQLLPHRQRPLVIDAASVAIMPSSTASTTLVQTNDGRAIVIASDFGPETTDPLVLLIKARRIHSVAAIIVTSIAPSTSAGIARFLANEPMTGPVIIPYCTEENEPYGQRLKHDLITVLQRVGVTVLPWDRTQDLLSIVMPLASIQFVSPSRKRWEAASLAVRVNYGDSSLLDVTGLNPRQLAELTCVPFGGPARLLLVSGQDQYLTKELLSEVQPDAVVLTGPVGDPPGNGAIDDVKAADATVVSLASVPQASFDLPFSSTDSVLEQRK